MRAPAPAQAGWSRTSLSVCPPSLHSSNCLPVQYNDHACLRACSVGRYEGVEKEEAELSSSGVSRLFLGHSGPVTAIGIGGKGMLLASAQSTKQPTSQNDAKVAGGSGAACNSNSRGSNTDCSDGSTASVMLWDLPSGRRLCHLTGTWCMPSLPILSSAHHGNGQRVPWFRSWIVTSKSI